MKKQNWTERLAAVVGVFVLLTWCAASAEPNERSPSTEGSHFGPNVLPFSLVQVLDYFDDAFGKPAYRGYDHAYLYHLEDSALDESVTITVSEMEQRISVTLVTNADWGVNYLREFFEAPFFNRSESEQLYALLDEKTGVQSVELSWFGVDAGIFEVPDWLIVIMEFWPPGHPPAG